MTATAITLRAGPRTGRATTLFLSPKPPPCGGMETWTELFEQEARRHEIPFRVVDTRSPIRDAPEGIRMGKLLFGVRLLQRVRAAVARPDVGLVHINCSFFPWSALRDQVFMDLAHRRGLPVVVQLHGGLPPGRWESLPRLARWAYRRLLEGAQAVVVLSHEVADSLRRAGLRTRRLERIPNFLPADWRVARAPVTEGVLFTGKIARYKGSDLLTALAQQLPDVQFDWVGRMVDTVTIPANVRWHGEQPAGHVAGYYGRSRVFVFPSRLEGLPMSVVEAMAAGLPVVTTRTGAMPEMIDEGAGGFLHAVADVDGMAASVRRLLADPELCARMGEHNQRKVDREYRAAGIMARLLALYGELRSA